MKHSTLEKGKQDSNRLVLVHLELSDANEFVAKLHRHHKPVTGHRFSIGANRNDELAGVAIVGRPVARMTDQRNIVEVLRLCTDGSHNACSFLYGASARAAKSLGYQKIQTFILDSEPGTSLKAAGWELEWTTDGGSWDTPTRRREDHAPTCQKQKWVKYL